jgi:hypothetical protein
MQTGAENTMSLLPVTALGTLNPLMQNKLLACSKLGSRPWPIRQSFHPTLLMRPNNIFVNSNVIVNESGHILIFKLKSFVDGLLLRD